MLLATVNIHNDKIYPAAEEALSNAELLCLCGYFGEALEITQSLITEGPWKIGTKTALGDRLATLHTLNCHMNSVDCPALGTEPARSVEELAELADETAQEFISYLLALDRLQLAPAGQGWDESYIAQVMEMKQEGGRYVDYGKFSNDVELILKARLRKLLGTKGPDLFGGIKDQLQELLQQTGKKLLGSNIEGLDLIPATDSDIQIAAESTSFSSHYLCECLEKCASVFEENDLPYLVENAFSMMLLIDLVEGDTASAARTAKLLLPEESRGALLSLAYWPRLGEFLSTHAIAEQIELTAGEVESYLAQFQSRKTPKPDIASSRAHIKAPSSSFDEFKDIVADSDLYLAEVIELEIPEHDEGAFAIQVEHSSALKTWEVGRSLVGKTRRWPVLYLSWGGADDSWRKTISEDDLLFDRDAFAHELFEEDRHGVTVKELLKGADALDLEAAISHISSRRSEYIDDNIEYELEKLGAFENSLPAAEVLASDVRSRDENCQLALAKWLWEWRREHPDLPAIEAHTTHMEWFEPSKSDMLSLIFLPTEYPWEVPAYIQWYGGGSVGTEVVVAMLKDWHRRYGAEVVAHYGTMLNILASSRPETIDEAIVLAFEQDMVAQCTLALPGVSILEHAVALQETNRWFLHERP